MLVGMAAMLEADPVVLRLAAVADDMRQVMQDLLALISRYVVAAQAEA